MALREGDDERRGAVNRPSAVSTGEKQSMSDTQHLSPEPLGALEAGKRIRPCLAAARTAFQRGLGDAGTCTAALLIFDDGADLPTLAFQFVTADGGSHLVSERTGSPDCGLAEHIEERGAAAATAFRAGLMNRGSNNGRT
jgi:hypothetical protein